MKLIELLEGITHLEDLPIEKFLYSIKNINLFEITEKIDGANLQFGIDENNKFFTSREAKGGNKFYSIDDWGKTIWFTGFKSAHKVLEKAAKILVQNKLLFPNDTIEVEILFGKLPNVVNYKGDVNQIILLRPIQSSTGDLNELSKRLEIMKNTLENLQFKVNIKDVPYTDDGKTIKYREETHVWRISKTPKVDKEILNKQELKLNLEKNLKEIEEYLNSASKIGDLTNLEILSLQLNKKPEKLINQNWNELKQLIKIKKEEILNHLRTFKLNIKEELLQNFVRNISSKFGPSLEEGGWIEGVVFRNPYTNEQFKLVDKDIFTKINKFLWKIRSLIKESKQSEKIADISNRLLKRIAEALGRPDLSRNITIVTFVNNALKKNKNPIEELADSIKNFDNSKAAVLEALNYYRRVLDRFLTFYNSNKEKLALQISVGDFKKEVKYDEEVDRKTKESFAEMFRYIDETIEKVKNTKNKFELASIFLEGKIKK